MAFELVSRIEIEQLLLIAEDTKNNLEILKKCYQIASLIVYILGRKEGMPMNKF